MNESYRRTNPEIKEILTRNTRETAFDGTVLEGRERRYTILKEADLVKYCTEAQLDNIQLALDDVLTTIQIGREDEGKKPYNSYIVINVDEPYIEEVVGVMKKNGHW